jgi:iron complex outermembrane recepter protein
MPTRSSILVDQMSRRACGLKYALGSAASLLAMLPPQPASAQVAQPAPAATALANQGADEAADQGVADIVVTATRQKQSLSKVPISISAFSNDKLQSLGLKSIGDIARFSPGVQFDSERKDVAIRGVSSQAGTGTTGIYIDDTPIQIRALGLNANNTAPVVFDLERVEVLRGPQGTLFGAGSEGGTVRYITPQPGLRDYSGYSRGELSFTERGAPSYELGQAIGGPIIADTLGFRVSAYYRRDGGYIDRIDDATSATTTENANSATTLALRGALAWKPAENVTLTPSIFYQDHKQRQNDRYWVDRSADEGHLVNGTPDTQADNDHFTLASLKIEADLGSVTAISNTSYFNRKEVVGGYSGTLYNLSLFQQLITNDNGDGTTGANFNLDPYSNSVQAASAAGYPLLTGTGINLPQFPGYRSQVYITNKQENWTQELRFQSADPTARLTWVVGAFLQSNKQTSTEEINDPQLPDLVPVLFGGTFLDFADGIPLLPNGDDYINNTNSKDTQIAVFADATFAVTDKLKLTAGMRYAHTKFTFDNYADGPQNVGYSSGTGSQAENPFTPKFGINYQIDPDNLVYGSVAKGFRIGGANPPFPQELCQADLDALQITSVPSSYTSDKVWSYEVGTKNRLLDHKLSFAGSAYYLEWSNIQQANYLPSCGFQYTGNLGTVHSKGFDAQLQWAVVQGLNVDLAVGYNDVKYSVTTLTGGPDSPPLSNKGNTIPGVAPWTISAGAQYNFELASYSAYVRGDYLFRSHNSALTPGQDPLSAVNDPSLVNDPATTLVNLRAGMTIKGVEAQIFVDNVFDSQPQLDLAHQDQFTLLYEAQTFRPRTFGMALSYSF